MPDKNNNEFNTFGFVTNKMRTGIITAFMGLLVVAIIALQIQLKQKDRDIQELNDKLINTQDKLYRQTIEYLRPTVNKMDKAAEKVDTVASKVDSATSKLINRK